MSWHDACHMSWHVSSRYVMYWHFTQRFPLMSCSLACLVANVLTCALIFYINRMLIFWLTYVLTNAFSGFLKAKDGVWHID